MFDAEIDQSGRTDVLTVDTALALANGVERAVLIPKSVKQRCYAQWRDRGMRKALIGIRLFSAGLVLWRTFKGYHPPDKRITFHEICQVC